MGVAEGYDHQRINPPRSLAGGSGPMRGLLDEVNPIQADRDAYIANATKPKSFLSRNRRSILNEPQSVKPVKRNNLLEDETGWEQNPYFWSTLIDRGLDFGFNE